MKTGLIVGKFYPPHLGHQYLIDVAEAQVEKLYVVVGSLPTEAIPAEKRVEWLKGMTAAHKTEVINLPDNNPEGVTPDQDDYWDIWAHSLMTSLPTKPDVIFSSEKYGEILAKRLGIEYVTVDPDRLHVPISATMIRANPQKYWQFISPDVQTYYGKPDVQKIWIISDTHFLHEKIKQYEGRPDDFNEVIIRNWNKKVSPGDLVIHLGDVIFGPNKAENLPPIMAQLNGKKILCRGNHDEHDWLWYMEKGFDFVCDYFVYKNIAFSHAPLTPLPTQTQLKHSTPVDFNIHGHFHRGKHRSPSDNPNYVDDFYDFQYWKINQDKYQLIQIEDKLRPFLLEEVLGWRKG